MKFLNRFRKGTWVEMQGWLETDEKPERPNKTLRGPVKYRPQGQRRWKGRFADLKKDAVIRIYKSRRDQEQGLETVVCLDLALSSVRYCVEKTRFVIRCGESKDHLLRCSKRAHFDDWLEVIRLRRVYYQYTLMTDKKVPQSPKSTRPTPSSEAQSSSSTTAPSSTSQQETKEKKSLRKDDVVKDLEESEASEEASSQTVTEEDDEVSVSSDDAGETADAETSPVLVPPRPAGAVSAVLTWATRKKPKRSPRSKLPAPMPPDQSISFATITEALKGSLPVALCEPLTFLQVMCEELEYRNLLEKALKEKVAEKRMSLVVAFVLSFYANTKDRSRKPFNAKVGETYEFDRWEDEGWRFHAEQVARKPDQFAGHAEGSAGWVWWQSYGFKLKPVWGFSPALLAEPAGSTGLQLKNFKETYHWNKLSSQVDGILNKEKKIVHFGKLSVSCSNGYTADVTFDKHHSGTYKGKVKDANGNNVCDVKGVWFTSCELTPRKGTAYTVFTPTPRPINAKKYYNMSQFALQLNALDQVDETELPPTDSRFRKDIRLLEDGKIEDANATKLKMEAEVRAKRERGEGAKPIWFKQQTGYDSWTTKGNYWIAKKKQFEGINIPTIW